MKSRILFSSKTAEPTGPTTSLGLLVDRMAAYHDVTVLFPRDGEFRKRLEGKGISYRSVPSLGRRSIPGLVRFLRRERFDLVYVNEVSRASRHVCIAAVLSGTPFISHVRSMGWQQGWTRLGHLKWARAVIAVSQACGNSVARFVESERLHVVHNGVPLALLANGRRPEGPSLKEELGLPVRSRLVLHVGHVTPRKGQVFALEAMKQVVREAPTSHLCLAGALDRDPGYVRRVRSLCAEPELEGRVTVLGFRPDVHRLLSEGDVLVHTALADPHPRAVLEAMGAGLPVVAFATDGVTETVADGVTGYLVTKEDTEGLASVLVRVLSDEKLANRMGNAGQVRIKEHFSEARTSERIAKVIHRVLPPSTEHRHEQES